MRKYICIVIILIGFISGSCSNRSIAPISSIGESPTPTVSPTIVPSPSQIEEILSPTALPTETVSPSPIVESSTPTVSPTETLIPSPSQDEELIKKEIFVQNFIEALNNFNVDFISRNLNHSFRNNISSSISQGLELHRFVLKGEQITSFERLNNPNLRDDIDFYELKTESGLTRCVGIEKSTKSDIGYAFTDFLISQGPHIVSIAESYLNALKSKDIRYLYNYLVNINEDAEAAPYTDPNHDKEYERIALALVSKYEQAFDLESMQLQLKNITENDWIVRIEYNITGKSLEDKPVEHQVTGIFEFPITGMGDTWLEE